MTQRKRIPLDVAHQVLATFGINEPTALYERRAEPEGLWIDDLHAIIAEGRFVLGVDWRAALPEELSRIASAVSELGAELEVEVAADADEGWVICGSSCAPVKYVPSHDDDFTDVIRAVQGIVPPAIEFRESLCNGQNDGWEFAVLLREEWSALEALDAGLIGTMFRCLSAAD